MTIRGGARESPPESSTLNLFIKTTPQPCTHLGPGPNLNETTLGSRLQSTFETQEGEDSGQKGPPGTGWGHLTPLHPFFRLTKMRVSLLSQREKKFPHEESDVGSLPRRLLEGHGDRLSDIGNPGSVEGRGQEN